MNEPQDHSNGHAEKQISEKTRFDAAAAMKEASELLEQEGADAGFEPESEPGLPETDVEFISSFIIGLNLQRDEIVAYARAQSQNPYRPELQIRSVVRSELDRLAGGNKDERRVLVSELLNRLIEDFGPEQDTEFSDVVLQNLFDGQLGGRDSIANELTVTDMALITERSLGISLDGVAALATIHEMDRMISAQPKEAEAELSAAILRAEAVTALRMLRALESTGASVASRIEGNEPAFNAIGRTILAAEQHPSPLVAMMAYDDRRNIQLEFLAQHQDISDANREELLPDEINALLDHNAEAFAEMERQAVLVEGDEADYSRREAQGGHDVRVARDGVGQFNQIRQLGSILKCQIRVRNGRMIVPLDGYDGSEDYLVAGDGLDDLMIVLHEPTMRKHVEDHLGVSLCEVSLEAQGHLLDFMAGANRETYDRLGAVMQAQPDLGSGFLEAFLALEQGDEFGESLLTIAENAPAEQSKDIIGGLARVRKMAVALGREYGEFDETFSEQVEQAWIRRATQLLLNAELLAKGDQPSAELYNGDSVTISDLSEVTWGLERLQAAMAAELKGLREGGGEVIREDSSTATVRMPDGSLRQFRPYAATEAGGTVDMEHHFDNEARANALYSEGDLSPEENRDHPTRQRALSIRFDREGMWRKESGEPWLDRQGKPVNEPAGVHGWVSLDIGSIFGEPDDPNVRLGRLLAVGEAQYAKRRGQHPNFNHVREVFDSKFGQAEEFARLVKYLQERALRPVSSSEKLAA